MPMRATYCTLLLLPALLHAQTDPLTPGGIRAIPDDSAYALAVDPAAYRGYGAVFLLDDGVLSLERDGRSTFTYRQVVQVLTAEAVAAFAERRIAYQPARQRLRVNRLRVLAADGSVLSDGPIQQQEAFPPVVETAPVYTDTRILHVTAGGVAPGTLVDFSYTIETYAPQLPGDWLYRWVVGALSPVRRSRFAVDTPEDLPARLRQYHLPEGADETRQDGRRLRTWRHEEVPAIETEHFMAPADSVLRSIDVAGALSWAEIGAWYAGVLRDRLDPVPAVVAAFAPELQAARSADDSLRAAHRWVAQDFRYVSLSLGDGGYEPRPAAAVLETRFGDCKDKAALFVSLARHLGFAARPVLVNWDSPVDSTQPSLGQFDHMIAAIDRRGRTEYTDLTVPLLPYGTLPMELQGQVGLAIDDQAANARLVVLPATPTEVSRYEQTVSGAVTVDGRFQGSITIVATGAKEPLLRAELEGFRAADQKGRDAMALALATQAWEKPVVDSSELFDGRDLGHAARARIWFTIDHAVGTSGSGYVMYLPVATFGSPSLASALATAPARHFPIDIAQLNDASVAVSTFEVTLPDGWKANLPADVSVQSPFGSYRARYRQAGRTVRVSREIAGGRGVLPPDSAAAMLRFVKAVADDDFDFVTLERGAGPALATVTVPVDSAHLPGVLLTPTDLSAEAAMVSDGPPGDESPFSFVMTDALESLEREFAPRQLVFPVGESRLLYLVTSGAIHHTHTEAAKMIGLVDLMDFASLFAAMLAEVGMGQASIGATRAIDLTSVGDLAVGQILEFVTPLATFDFAFALVVRGRATLGLMAMGAQGVREADLTRLLSAMDERLQPIAALQRDLAVEDYVDDSKSADADSAVAPRADGVPLDAIVLPPQAFRPPVRYANSFTRADGYVAYGRTVEGQALTFRVEHADAIAVEMTVRLYASAAGALKSVLLAEQAAPRRLMRDFMGGSGDALSQLMTEGLTVRHRDRPAMGEPTTALTGEVRGIMNFDADLVLLAHGRLLLLVNISRTPGTSDPAEASELAQRLLERAAGVVHVDPAGTLPDDRVEAIRAVVASEVAVDSLLVARDLTGVFATITRARLDHAPVSFEAATWTDICRWGGVYGFAREALTACDTAVASDSSKVERRDYRAVARALAGRRDGAVADLRYIVDQAEQGDFLDIRAAWLAALEAGDNPFTEAVLAELRKERPHLTPPGR